MAGDVPRTVLKDVAALFRAGTLVGLSDRMLIDRFLEEPVEPSQAAFSALVDRHGPMVLRACRRILGDVHDAEDAAQATFLLLARKARSIRGTDSVAGWLYGTAARVAARLRRDAARRRRHELARAERTTGLCFTDNESDRFPELYEELGRLPERFRLPAVLCYLEGLTYEQTAARLGCPVRTVQSRLTRAKERLRNRLARRGLRPAIADLSASLAGEGSVACAAVSESWKQTTLQAAFGDASGIVPAAVISLVEGALRLMRIQWLARWAAGVTILGGTVGAAGVGLFARSGESRAEGLRQLEPPPRQVANSQPKAQRPNEKSAVAAADRYQVRMPGGVTFEIVAVSSFPAGPKSWWRPDGTPIDQAPADPPSHAYDLREGEQARVVLARITDRPKDATLRWLPADEHRRYAGIRPTKDGKATPELDAYIISRRPDDRSTCDVRIKLAVGPWKKEASDTGKRTVSMDIHGHRFYFGKARPCRFEDSRVKLVGTSIAVAHDIADRDMRLIALDLDGKEHQPYFSTAGMGASLNLLDTEFNLPTEQIRAFQVMSRPFQLAEIKDVALEPTPIIGAGFFDPPSVRRTALDHP